LVVAALALAAATGAAAIPAYPTPFPPGDCRNGSPACPEGCCNQACPTGASGIAIPSGIPGLTASIKGLTYDPKTALVKGTVVMTNSGKQPVNNLIAGVQFTYAPLPDGTILGGYWMDNLECGGQRGKTLAPGASRACPFALVGGADPATFDYFSSATAREPLPGVNPAALKAAQSFAGSDAQQTTDVRRGVSPSAVSAKATLRNVDFDPRYDDKSGGFVCKYAFVPAVAA
jgi:hypothetical protein